jgi:hypothetical protein
MDTEALIQDVFDDTQTMDMDVETTPNLYNEVNIEDLIDDDALESDIYLQERYLFP